MKTLEQLGVTIRRGFVTQSSSTEVGGEEVASSTKKSTQLTLKLPGEAPIQATFSAEGIGHKVVKIFKREVQCGDPSFDDAVYIETQTPEKTAHMLQSPDVRELIKGLLVHGPVAITGSTVTLTVPGHVEGEDESAVRLINTLLR